MNVIVVGSVAFDAIKTPFAKTKKIIGGAGTYISLSSSCFSSKIKLVSIVGNDFPDDYIQFLKSKNIDIEGLEVDKNDKTFFWEGEYFNDMNSRKTIVTELNVLEKFNPKLPVSYQGAEFLMLGNLSPIVQRQVIEQLKTKPKLIVMDTMNFWMDIMLDELLKTIAMVDVLTINDEEARQLSGEYSLVKAAKKILKLGPKYLIIKKGEHGALLFNQDEVFFAPALPLEEVFDPTGAGDTFAGGFIGYISTQEQINMESMKTAIIYGSTMASFCVEKFGTENLQNLTQKQIKDRFNEFVKLVKFEI